MLMRGASARPPAVTLSVCSHAQPSRMREAADAVDALYG